MPLGEARESPRIKVEPEEPHPEGVSPETRAQGARGWVPLSQGAKEKVCFLPGGGEKGTGERGPFPAPSPGRETQVSAPPSPQKLPDSPSEPTDPPLGSGWGWSWRQREVPAGPGIRSLPGAGGPSRARWPPEDLSPLSAPPAPQSPVLSREGRTRDRQMATALLTAWSQVSVHVQGWRRSQKTWRDSVYDGAVLRIRVLDLRVGARDPELWKWCREGVLLLSCAVHSRMVLAPKVFLRQLPCFTSRPRVGLTAVSRMGVQVCPHPGTTERLHHFPMSPGEGAFCVVSDAGDL